MRVSKQPDQEKVYIQNTENVDMNCHELQNNGTPAFASYIDEANFLIFKRTHLLVKKT